MCNKFIDKNPNVHFNCHHSSLKSMAVGANGLAGLVAVPPVVRDR